MSRIGNMPIPLPQGVEFKVSGDNVVSVKGPNGQLECAVDRNITLEVADGEIRLQRASDHRRNKSMHGLYRSLVNNMVEGVSKGYELQLELVGVGFKATVSGQVLEMNLGYSHDIVMALPSEVSATAEMPKGKPPVVTLKSADKQLIGQVAAKIRSLRKVEPYKGKGVKFVGEQIRRKAGKTSAK